MSIIDLDKWQEIYQVLRKNKLRTFFTAFGVFWGIFMLMIMLGSGNGLRNGVTRGFGNFATNSFFMWTQQTSKPFKGFKRGRYFNFRNADIEAIKQGIPEIAVLAPRLQAGGYRGATNVVRGRETGAFNLYGDYPEYFTIDPLKLERGRVINYTDIQEKRKVVVIGDGVVDALFKKHEDPIGEYIRIQGVYFKVVGTVSSKKQGGEAERDANSIFLPFSTLQKTFNYGDRVFWFAVTSQENVPASVAEDKMVALLKERHSVHPDDDEAIGHFNVEKEFNKMKGLFFGINGLIWLVGTGTLLAGVIGVSNIMLIVVKERTKEIGIQRAIGARPISVITQIILESVFLTTLAGYIGLVIGVGAIELVDYLLTTSGADSEMFLNPEVNFRTAVSALIILIFSGIFAGFIPARRAVSIRPIEALRDE